MAEGEGEYLNLAYYDDTNNNDDDDDQEINRTGPPDGDSTWGFVPGSASTPGEQYEMQTMMSEQSGLHDFSYEKTPLLGAQAEQERSWDALTRLYAKASATDLETSYGAGG